MFYIKNVIYNYIKKIIISTYYIFPQIILFYSNLNETYWWTNFNKIITIQIGNNANQNYAVLFD